MTLWRIVKRFHQRMPLERLLDDAPLDPASAAVNESHVPQSSPVRGVHVLFDYRLDVTRVERM